MICNRCGRLIQNNSKYCGYCGNIIIGENLSKSQGNISKKARSKNKVFFGVIGIILLVIAVFMIVRFYGGEDILMQGVEFGMSKSEVASKVKLDNLYNEDDYYLGYAAFSALIIDEKNIGAEVHFSFNSNDELYEIEYEFEGADTDAEIVVDYLNSKYSGENFACHNGKVSGEKECSDYYLRMKGYSMTLKSKQYFADNE